MSGIDIGGFIKDANDESSSIRVIFKPMPVPPQEIVLKAQTSIGSQKARDFEQSNPRNSTIVKVLSILARGDLPEGYSLGPSQSTYMPSQCYQEGLQFDFSNGQLASGGDYVVAIGTVKNITTHDVAYDVSNCFSNKNVIANTSYPHDVLRPSQSSESFVMFYRNKPEVKKVAKRQSLLGD
jgi:hypothetical protein